MPQLPSVSELITDHQAPLKQDSEGQLPVPSIPRANSSDSLVRRGFNVMGGYGERSTRNSLSSTEGRRLTDPYIFHTSGSQVGSMSRSLSHDYFMVDGQNYRINQRASTSSSIGQLTRNPSSNTQMTLSSSPVISVRLRPENTNRRSSSVTIPPHPPPPPPPPTSFPSHEQSLAHEGQLIHGALPPMHIAQAPMYTNIDSYFHPNIPQQPMLYQIPHPVAGMSTIPPYHQSVFHEHNPPKHDEIADDKIDTVNKKRVIKRRTRTGCLTCRKRRIKCDERKPHCYNCERSKKVCLGYDDLANLKHKKRIPQDPSNDDNEKHSGEEKEAFRQDVKSDKPKKMSVYDLLK